MHSKQTQYDDLTRPFSSPNSPSKVPKICLATRSSVTFRITFCFSKIFHSRRLT